MTPWVLCLPLLQVRGCWEASAGGPQTSWGGTLVKSCLGFGEEGEGLGVGPRGVLRGRCGVKTSRA